MLGFINPIVDTIITNYRTVIIGSLLVGLLTVGITVINVKFSEKMPRMNTIAYTINKDTNEANWFSADDELDFWTEQFFSQEKRQGTKKLAMLN